MKSRVQPVEPVRFSCFAVAAIIFLSVQTPRAALAEFHKETSSDCLECHSSTGAEDDMTDMCLRCHASEIAVLTPDGSGNLPGGDFYWLNEPGHAADFLPERHGHNVASRLYGLAEESIIRHAPGGTYKSEWLGCTSCHDPHAEPGAYRMLAGVGYGGGAKAEGFAFRYPAPRAEADASILTEGESAGNSVRYISGMSRWCANCHEYFLDGEHLHPSGAAAPLNKTASAYGREIQEGGAWEVPVESEANGAVDQSNVMCLTCHRAHSSPYRSIVRMESQTSLCQKCHVW